MSAPVLEGESLAAVQHRGGHLQIIAAAGSGKTEVAGEQCPNNSMVASGDLPPASIAELGCLLGYTAVAEARRAEVTGVTLRRHGARDG